MLTLTHFEINNHQVALVVPEPYFAVDLFKAIKVDFSNLNKWVPWADKMNNQEDEADYLQLCKEELATSKNQAYVILVDGIAAGMIDYHNFNSANHSVEIGYWLASKFQHNGIVTASVKNLVGSTQQELSLHKVSILMDVKNIASRMVPQRLGFKHEARLKDHLYRNGEYHDADIYYKIVD